MLINQDELQRRLNSQNNLANLTNQVPAERSGANGAAIRSEHPVAPSEPHVSIAPSAAAAPPPTAPPRGANEANGAAPRPVGRPKGSLGAGKPPDSIRVIAAIAVGHDKPAEVRKEFGLTQNQLQSARNSQSSEIRKRIEEGRDRVSELALNQLMGSLGLLTPDRIEQEKPKDQAAIAASLSRVVANMTPKESDATASDGVKVLIYAPQQKTEEKYTVIDV